MVRPWASEISYNRFKLDNFLKMIKKAMKIYFFENSKEILWFLKSLLKLLQRFSGKFRKVSKYWLLGGLWAEPLPEESKNIEKYSKNQWKQAKFRKFPWIFSEFWLV